jgi:hypothetical protein
MSVFLGFSHSTTRRLSNVGHRSPLTIAGQFNKVLFRITPNLRDLQTYGRHELTVKKRLKTVFEANNVIRIGSYSRGSSIRSFSDIDLMLILERHEVRRGQEWKTSTSILNRVRNELLLRYPYTEVVRDAEAVVVRFGANQHPIEVVPAFYLEHGGARNYPIFAIPNGDGWWMRTSPQIHNKFIEDANTQSGGKLKNVARLIRFWMQCWQAPIPLSGFYVEVLLARDGICNGAKSYAHCVNDVLATLANSECDRIADPMEVAEFIDAAGSQEKRRRAQVATLSSAKRAYRALTAEVRGDVEESSRLWNLVFNGRFPLH